MRKIVEKEKKIDSHPFTELFDRIIGGEKKVTISGLQGSAKSFLLSLISRRINKTLIVITPTEKEAKDIHQDMTFFLDSENKSLLYPPWDFFSTDMFTFQQDVELSRMEVLCHLLIRNLPVVVVPMKAMMQRVIPRKELNAYIETISIGDVIDRDDLVQKLSAGGFNRVTLVDEKGQFSLRGHVIDIFPPISAQPVRMEFIGDELESIRQFDPVSQRSTGELIDFILAPTRDVILTEDRRQQAIENIKYRAIEQELPRMTRTRLIEMIENDLISSINPMFLSLFYESLEKMSREIMSEPPSKAEKEDSRYALGMFFDYIPEDCAFIFDDFPAVEKAQEDTENDMDRFLLKARNEEKFYLEKDFYYLSKDAFLKQCANFAQVYLEGLHINREAPDENNSSVLHMNIQTDLDVKTAPTLQRLSEGEGLLKPIVEKIARWLHEGNLVTFLGTGQEEVERLDHLLKQYNLPVSRANTSFPADVEQHSGKGRLVVREGRVTEGFHLPDLKLVVITEEEVFGRKVTRRRTRHIREGFFLKSFGDLKEGDYAVHTDHGIGAYRGLQKLTIGEIENDFLLLEYLDGDKLYIPIDRLDQIQRYIGPEGFEPRIDKLGGSSWETVKEKVKKSVREVAEELVSIYAAREVMDGYSFSPPDRVYDEFCSTFEYEETPDQSRSIEDVLLDMGNDKPMDRLVCGDAGFGKTEVALRASFRAAMDGKQVAVLVPTTILAEQHFQTFSRRLRDYPVCVEVLNRLKTAAEQKKIVEGVNKGTVDIVVGTHRLLQSDIKFKDLGLVIIDEEQRFGVTHKEKLKKLRTLVDVLTLTATPIPRTLHLSLVGIRDLSIINTPPEDRLPIKTHVFEFNEDTIRDAIRQELDRSGQVFFLHDRVHSIYTMARFVEKLIPEARVGIVHGRMKGKDIEDAMAKFIRGDYNVLVCTSIIASGLDIPTANTIIINRADRFGLAQLYQIRGRVGRSKEEASAFLLVPKGAMLSRDTQRRLRVIMDFSEPGSGFRIASNDLEIRGAGNILGTSQSGQIAAVGYELYTELMERTIREIKGEKMPEDEAKPEIHLGLPAFIPEDYMPDVHRRLVTYKRLSMASTDEDLSRIREEIMDCYGFVPFEVENLLEVISIRNMLKVIRGKKMGYDGQSLFIDFHRDSPVNPSKIVELSRKKARGVKLTPDLKLIYFMPDLRTNEIIRQSRELIQKLIN
ncbi:MAG TPA: transcription-repair coupling factor [Syntrophales bacterium]|nr:transcription-repair coupling factor [Syntrophales bacterium]